MSKYLSSLWDSQFQFEPKPRTRVRGYCLPCLRHSRMPLQDSCFGLSIVWARRHHSAVAFSEKCPSVARDRWPIQHPYRGGWQNRSHCDCRHKISIPTNNAPIAAPIKWDSTNGLKPSASTNSISPVTNSKSNFPNEQ